LNNFNFLSFFLGLAPSIFIIYLTDVSSKKRELKKQIIDIYKLSSELLNEINLFLKTQKFICEHYEEYREREYAGRGFEPLENADSLINLRNKNFADFFAAEWLDKFYYFFALCTISFPKLTNDLDELHKLIEDIYVVKEISSIEDEPQEFYNYINEKIIQKFNSLHEKIRKDITSKCIWNPV